MSAENQNSTYKEFAANYDSQVNEYNSYGHDVLFGMSFNSVEPGQNMLDIGIGTGLASEPFARYGLNVYGLDSDENMMEACRSKAFATALNLFDLTKDPIPYKAAFFDQAISCGVLHFAGELERIFAEVRRVLKTGGNFSFTFAPLEADKGFAPQDTAWGVLIYKHATAYVYSVLQSNHFKLEKEQRLLIKGADKINYDMLFSAVVAQAV